MDVALHTLSYILYSVSRSIHVIWISSRFLLPPKNMPDWYPVLFLPHSHYSQDRIQTQCDPDQDITHTKDE